MKNKIALLAEKTVKDQSGHTIEHLQILISFDRNFGCVKKSKNIFGLIEYMS
jgi:hypothetical protein